MDPALGLGIGHALDPVHAALELQAAEHPVAGDRGDDLLVAAHLAFRDAVDLDLPAPPLGVALVHAEQIAGEQRRLVPAGAGAHLQDDRGVLVLVAGRQQQGHVALEIGQAGVQPPQLLGGEGGHVGVVRAGHLRQLGGFSPGAAQPLHRVGDRLQLGVFLAQSGDLGAFGGRAHARFHLVEAVEHGIEFGLGQTHEGG